MMVDVDKVMANPQQPRRLFDEESLHSLAESLRTEGLLNPISVIGPVDDGVFILEDGERRLRAARMAGWAQIEASVKSPNGNITDVSLLMHALIGNLQREEMGPVDEARAYEKLNVLGLAHSEIGRQVGKSQSYISSRIRMLQFPEEIQELFNGGFLPIDERVMYALRRMPEEAQIRAAKRAATMRLDASRILALCSRMMATAPKVNSKAMIRALRSDDMPALAMNEKLGEVSGERLTAAVRAECKACGMYDDLKLCRSCPLVKLIERLADK